MNPNFSAEITVTSLSDIIRQEDIVYKYISGLKPLVHFDDLTLLDNKILVSLHIIPFILSYPPLWILYLPQFLLFYRISHLTISPSLPIGRSLGQ